MIRKESFDMLLKYQDMGIGIPKLTDEDRERFFPRSQT